MTERRKFMRFNTLLDVHYKKLGTAEQKLKSSLTDLSRDGLKLSGEQSLQKGSVIEFEIIFPSENLHIFAEGEVTWTSKSESNNYNSGIRFIKIAPFDRSKLLDYAYDKWLTEKRNKR